MYLIDSSTQLPQRGTLILAHGAGAGMDSSFMNAITAALNSVGVSVIRFEFPYMKLRRALATKRPPDRAAVLLEHWRQVYHQVLAREAVPKPLFIGGKSMGGRIATMLADELGVAAVCCFGYPFHPVNNLQSMRTEHLENIRTPILILQGDRDALGKPAELEEVNLSANVRIQWFEDGDHDLKPRVKSGLTQQQHICDAAQAVALFVAEAEVSGVNAH